MDNPINPQEPPKNARSRLRRFLASVARVTLLSWVGILLVLYAFQTRLIFPGAATQNTAEAAFDCPPEVERLTLTTAGGERVAAVFGAALTSQGTPVPDAARRPTLLYF